MGQKQKQRRQKQKLTKAEIDTKTYYRDKNKFKAIEANMDYQKWIKSRTDKQKQIQRQKLRQRDKNKL